MYSAPAIELMQARARESAHRERVESRATESDLDRLLARAFRNQVLAAERRLEKYNDPEQRELMRQSEADAIEAIERAHRRISALGNVGRLFDGVSRAVDAAKRDPHSGYYPDYFTYLLTAPIAATVAVITLEQIVWRLAAEAAILDLFRRAQWSTQDASTPAGDQRIQTLTAPHGPDARGVTLAA